MRKLEAVVKEIQDEMGYLQRREMKMRDTNGALRSLSPFLLKSMEMLTRTVESTNTRVKNFSILIMIGIVALGAWQVSYPNT